MKTIKAIAIFSLLLSACVQPLKYSGQKYPSTTSVDVFSSTAEIKKPYKVVGHLTIHRYSSDIMKKYLSKDAKKVGADAIIISADNSSSGDVTADVLKYDK